jgi:hypothetical protein
VIVLRVLGGALLLMALVVLGYDLFSIGAEDARGLSATGELWYALDPGSLNLAQAAIQRHLWPELWDDWALPLLLWPAEVILGGLGLLLLLAGSLRRRRRRR